MNVLCLDLEGVLVPEIWQAVAEATAIDALRLTTRDVSDYDELMRHRLTAIAEHDLRYQDINAVIAGLDPLPGAVAFLNWARARFQIAILSDTFYEFGMPLMEKLHNPFLLCHKLEIEDDRITGYKLRQQDPKKHAVAAFQSLQLKVLAAGDSFNDVSMLQQADSGTFFCAPDAIAEQFPELERAANYEELKSRLDDAALRLQ